MCRLKITNLFFDYIEFVSRLSDLVILHYYKIVFPWRSINVGSGKTIINKDVVVIL